MVQYSTYVPCTTSLRQICCLRASILSLIQQAVVSLSPIISLQSVNLQNDWKRKCLHADDAGSTRGSLAFSGQKLAEHLAPVFPQFPCSCSFHAVHSARQASSHLCVLCGQLLVYHLHITIIMWTQKFGLRVGAFRTLSQKDQDLLVFLAGIANAAFSAHELEKQRHVTTRNLKLRKCSPLMKN